jgi:hypothetical protein
MVTRPLIEAVRGRLSRCGVCAPAHETDWLNANRSNVDEIEKRLSRDNFMRSSENSYVVTTLVVTAQ